MKRLIAILLLSAFVFGHISAQEAYEYHSIQRVDKWRGLKVAAWNLAASTIGAYGDAIRDDGNNWGWALNGVEAGMYVGGKWMWDIKGNELVPYIASIAFIRAGSFDITYNLSRGLPWYYTGSTKLWDKAWREVSPPPHGKAWFYGWSLTLGVSISICEL